jgi:Na+-translocating ferredoxin:NAD+ oxidoreductase subunit E
MKKQVAPIKEYVKGLWDINPVFRQLLGLCPTLAVTVTLANGIAMALATTFVLVFSSVLISMIKKLIPTQVRIAAYIVVIATFVTIADLVMKAKFPDLSKSLGPFIPLIVVNCIILGRAEAFASKNTPYRALLDALGNGTGFFIALAAMSGIREIIGTGTLLGYPVMPESFEPWLIMILPAGAFLTLGLLIGFSNAFTERRNNMISKAELERYKVSAMRDQLKAEEV